MMMYQFNVQCILICSFSIVLQEQFGSIKMSSSEIRTYLNNSSPLSRLQNSNKVPLREIHNSIDIKMTLMNDHPKNYETPKNKLKRSKLLSSTSKGSKDSAMQQFSQIKASSIIYNIPQLSPPEINFQISNKLRHKISELKQDIVTKLPIIKSSQFNTNKLQSLFSRRTVLKDLQDWLQQKLKSPPLTYEDSIEYKNMIMGVGMKQVIRLIGTRCAEEANIVNEIWELTWSICRQIILHLSKRAHKCQKILEQQATFFRNGCQTRIKDSEIAAKLFKQQNAILKQRSDKLAADLAKAKKKNKELRLTKLNLQGVNNQLKDEFQITFKQNLLLHLKMAPNDHQRRLWVKRKYASLINSSKKNNSLFKSFLDSVLAQNNLQLNEEQVAQIQLVTDLNKFKLEQNKRRFDVEQELLDKFKTYTQETQTIMVEKVNAEAQTLKIMTISIEVETDSRNKEEIGINTEPNNEIGSSSKSKNKKGTIKKSGVGSIDKDKKKDDTKFKLKQKMSMNAEITKEQQNEDEDVEKQELSKTEKLQRKPTIETIELPFDGEELHANQHGLERINEKQLNRQNGIIKQQIQPEETYQQDLKEHALQNVASQYEQTKGPVDIDEHIIHEELEKVIRSNSQDKIDSQQIKIKQQKIQQLRMLMLESERKHNIQIESMIKQIDSKKSTIVSLNRQLASLNQSTKIQKQKQSEPIQRIDSIMEDDQHELIKLLKDKKYQQLIKQIKIKATIQGEYMKNQEALNNLTKISGNLTPKENQAKCLSKNKLSLQYQYQKKVVNAGGNELQKKNSLHSNYNFGLQNEMIEEIKEKQVDAMQSIKTSRRSSNKSINEKKISLKDFSEEDIQQEEQFNININTLTFVDVCIKYFYQNSSVISQSSGAGTKQPSMSDYNKRSIRDQYREIYKQVMEGQHGQRNQKQMRTVVDKAINSLMKQLCKDIQTAQKQGLEKIQEVKINYSPMPILMVNRFNMNFGVKKVASKHVKDLLICLKGIKKYTQKYSVISYFMLYSPSLSVSNPILDFQDAQLLFFYIFLIAIMENIYVDHNINQDQMDTVIQLAKKYLTSDLQFISNLQNLPQIMKAQNNNTFINMYKKLITGYKNLYLQRSNQMQMIYGVLSRQIKQGRWGIRWRDFADFISVFDIKILEQTENHDTSPVKSWHSIVLNTMIQAMLEDKTSENGIISQECFIKFVVKCPQFNLTLIRNNIQSIIEPTNVDLSLEATQKQILAMCQQHDLLQCIAKYLFQTENVSESTIQFWVGYVKLYIVQSQTDSIISSLLNGVLNPKTSPVVLRLSITQNQI